MEAIILAGGLGTRLRPMVPDMPKPMAPVAGRPFLEILLLGLAGKGFTRVVLSLGFMAKKIAAHFGARFAGMDLLYEIEESPLGTGGAVRQALLLCRSDHVFIFNGDTYLDLEASAVEIAWQANHLPIIVARDVPDASRYGLLEVVQERVRSFAEKGASGRGLINAGCYVLPRNIFDGVSVGPSFSLETDFLAMEVRKRPFAAFVTQGYFIDIGVPGDYARAQTELAGR
jgi:D-glycero-alpha-D-manno-heptose 1-phosphate guanylyltransferase